MRAVCVVPVLVLVLVVDLGEMNVNEESQLMMKTVKAREDRRLSYI